MAQPLRFRRACAADESILLTWRNDDETRASSRSMDRIGPEEHSAWLEAVLASPDHVLLIAEVPQGSPVGSVRYDRWTAIDSCVYEVSVTVAPGNRGLSIGRELIVVGESYLRQIADATTVLANVKPENLASQRLFVGCGFRPVGWVELPGIWLAKVLPSATAG